MELLLTLLAVLLLLGCAQPVELPRMELKWLPEEDRPAVDLSGIFKTLDGEDALLTQEGEGGTPLFLNLWATWCGPCLEEMPAMANLYDELSERGLRMVAVSDEDPESVRHFMEEYSYPFQVLLDPDNVLGERFEVIAIPTTLVIDPEGKLALRQTGAYQWDSPELIEQFDPLLALD